MPRQYAPPPPARLLRLRHGGQAWAVAAEGVREVVGTERLQRNPRAARGFPYGWLLGDGEELPVHRLDREGTEAPHAASPGSGAVVVLQPAGGPPYGLRVDAAEGVREVPLSLLRLLPAPATGRRWAFPRVVLWEDGLALEVAIEAVPALDGGTGGGAGDGRQEPPAAGASRFQVPPLEAGSAGRLFVFVPPGCGELRFALPAAQVVEVMQYPPQPAVRPVPGAPESLLGLLAWRGEPLPVLDLARAVGLPAAPFPPAAVSRALVARAVGSRQLVVFPVERIVGLRAGPFPQPPAADPALAGARRILGAFVDGERVLLIPDLDGALLPSPEASAAADAGLDGR